VSDIIQFRDGLQAELARIDREIAALQRLRDETVKRFQDVMTAERVYGVRYGQ